MGRYYDRFLPADLNKCVTCHLPSSVKDPASLEEFPHNRFGDRLRVLGEELEDAGKKAKIPDRLAAVAKEDADGDGIENEVELLAGTNPGDEKDKPDELRLARAQKSASEFSKFLAEYRWQPFERVERPAIPEVSAQRWGRNPIDAFLAAQHARRGLKPRPETSKTVLLRRVYLDLIGLQPTPEEQRAFEADNSPDAYEKVVDRLLGDPRYGERWGRHWMDVWRYSDWAGWTDGKQVRDSQRHIWRWRDWIVDSLNADKPYDRMVVEMLAGDELAPTDPDVLRATGFLVRNYKMLSREQWLEDTVKHTAQAFLGVTLGCAKCHDHRSDPISQAEYYQVRAIFEPHQVRTDRVPGELDLERDGVPRVYDAEKDAKTFFLIRGDERKPDKDRAMPPGVPKVLAGSALPSALAIQSVPLPREAAMPDMRDFVIRDTIAQSEKELKRATDAHAKIMANTDAKDAEVRSAELDVAAAKTKHDALLTVIDAEKLDFEGKKGTDEWKAAARRAVELQRGSAVAEAKFALHKAEQVKDAAAARVASGDPKTVEAGRKELTAAEKKFAEAQEKLAKAEKDSATELNEAFKPRERKDYPAESTGRRLAFANWIADRRNPLTARVAVNHIWLRHFGRGLVATPENFGSDGARPSHPELLDWLAAELMERGWGMKAIHRLIVTSATYRMASTTDEANAAKDPDNVYLWRMPSRRMEAEIVRDNLLYAAGSLDQTRGGPEVDHLQGLKSTRRSIYLRSASEKEVEFLKIFDGPNVNECYQRRTSVMPQQSLALLNSELAAREAEKLAKVFEAEVKPVDDLVRVGFRKVLAREPSSDELAACVAFYQDRVKATDPQRASENLMLVLFNHHDFVTIR
jgi:glucan-binding YG repeat protein